MIEIQIAYNLNRNLSQPYSIRIQKCDRKWGIIVRFWAGKFMIRLFSWS